MKGHERSMNGLGTVYERSINGQERSMSGQERSMNGQERYLNDERLPIYFMTVPFTVPFRSVPFRSKTVREKTDQA